VEDIGLADPRAFAMTLDAWEAYDRLGSPEGELAIANAVVYLACAPKSNAVYVAMGEAMADVEQFGTLDVPLRFRNAPTGLMKNLGFGREYRYAHEEPDAYVAGEPGPGCAVANWLVERGVALTGCDTWSYGPVPAEDPDRPFEVPQILNARHGVFVVENLDTAQLAADGVREFALILTHPKLRGATGAWTSPIALV